MNTEPIKLRAWDPHRKIMIYDFESIDDPEVPEYYISASGGVLIIGTYDANGDWYELILLVSTGLKDRNNTEIYKADILEFDPREWGSNTGNRWAVEHDDASGEWDTGGGTNRECRDWKKVVGNVFENPELLNQDQ